ncbi:MAG: ABC transporter [Bacteroidetes bacterium]|nr:MAG: ABC transporter [Bacteroidota bacterium]PTM14670.1 MAG: ABC transporter [Bacteroidota bacterium]
MNTLENINIALGSVRDNWLRAILTLVIIAFGIMALVGILTAIDTAIYSLNANLSYLGANTFDIDPAGQGVSGNRRGRQDKEGAPFSYQQAMTFKERYPFPGRTSVSLFCSGLATIKYENQESNPNVVIFGIDENYLEARAYNIKLGRNFTAREATGGGLVTILGGDMVETLFAGNAERAMGKYVTTSTGKFRVIGVLESKGSSMNQSEDRRILIPLQTAKRYYGAEETSYSIMVSVNDPTRIEAAIGEATVTMRNIRKLAAGAENDFEITKSDSLLGIIKDNTVYLRLAAIAIGFITLLGAAIGLMNIMLVSVTERTREIGIRKALGATSRNILIQFLTEAVVICQMGGILGIILGVLIGNIVSVLFGSAFLFPWLWITVALITCTFVGLLSGLYPALRAAALDPIESLRYE